MKKLSVLIIVFIAFFMFDMRVDAARTYKRGIVKTYSYITTNPIAVNNSNHLKSDTNKNVYLESPEAVEIIGEENGFYKIKFLYSGFLYAGYIPKNNVIASEYTIDEAYEQSLVAMGFPSDYAVRLANLHAIHPNWNFAPSFTGGVQGGMDFMTAVKGEASVVSRNVIQTSNNSLKSTADGAYKNGVWLDLAGSGWHAASEQTIAFFLDARNFLDESHIFMFENLGYNPVTQTENAVDKVLNGTFMSRDKPFTCIADSYGCALGEHSFTETFINSGINRKVSPVHLASRVKQEQGPNGSTLCLGNGYDNQLKGYYNFFNIGASGKTDYEVIINGLTYAKNRNWNNQYVSIYEGSNLISSNYIGRGQSTGYYQKFNTIVSPLYGNQYMQNVMAPYREAYSTYTSYYKNYDNLSNWDNAVYDFLIPVYSNMGSYTTLDVSQNGDSTLKSLSITDCKLNPSFQSSAYEYNCYVKKEVTSLNISAEVTNPNSKLNNPGTVQLNSDEEKINITVTAPNGTDSTYVIYVHRIETDGYSPREILNNVGIMTSDNFVFNFEYNGTTDDEIKSEDVSNIISKITNTHHFATVKVFDANGTEITKGASKTGQTITITNAGTTESFSLVIYGDATGDGLIDIRDLLVLQKDIVGASKLSGAYLKAANVNKDKELDIRDLLLVQKYILGQYQIKQGIDW